MASPPHPATNAAASIPDIQTQKPFVAFQPGNVPPSQAAYLQLNDAIFIRTLANSTFPGALARYRYLTPQGEIKEGAFPLNIQSFPVVTSFVLGEAWLLSFLIDTVNSGSVGSWIHATVGIARGVQAGGAFPFQGLLWEGYLANSEPNGWPGGPSKQVWDGNGMPRSVIGTTPAAGADISEVVPAGRRWQLLYASSTLATSAVAGNRTVGIILDDGVNTLYQWHTSANQAASLNIAYTFAPGIPNGTDAINTDGVILPNTAVTLRPGYRIRTTTSGLLAGDQWQSLKYLILEWASIDA